MDEKSRQTSGSTTTSSGSTTTGSATTVNAELICGCPQPGPETIEVEQVLGAEMAQRVVEFDMTVPAQKPDIEQVIDVYVKDVCIKTVDVIPNKVIIRGELEVKVMYVADLPNQPVHAFEKDQVRFTRDIEILGAERGMDATADVNVEFVDYDFDCDDRRQVHITIVLKFWARVLTTTMMDVYALGPVTEIGDVETTTAILSTDTMTAASEFENNQFAGYGVQNVLVTGPGITPMAGVPMGVSGTATVTGNNVNVRTGPGTNFPVVVQVKKGDTLTIKDQAFGWYKVVLPDGSTTGWIASWLVNTGVPSGTKG